MSQHVAGERPNLSTAGPPKLRYPSRLLDQAGRPRGQTAPRANGPMLAVRARAADRCRRLHGGSPAVAPVGASAAETAYARTATERWGQGMTHCGPGRPNRSPEPENVRAP